MRLKLNFTIKDKNRFSRKTEIIKKKKKWPYNGNPCIIVFRYMDSGVKLPRFAFCLCHSLSAWPASHYLIFLTASSSNYDNNTYLTELQIHTHKGLGRVSGIQHPINIS